jgi:hypothetical protein
MTKKKLWYVPGMISIIGLPVILLLLPVEDKHFQTCLRLFVPSDERPVDGNIKFTKYFVYETIKKKKVERIRFGSEYYEFPMMNQYGDNTSTVKSVKQDFIRQEMLRMQLLHDTNTVLKIELGEESTYGDFVWIINQAVIFDFKRYAYTDNAVYLFSTPPPKQPEILLVSPDTVLLPGWKPPTKWDLFIWDIREQFEELIFMARKNYLLVSGFVLLIVIPAFVQLMKRLYTRKQKNACASSKPVAV